MRLLAQRDTYRYRLRATTSEVSGCVCCAGLTQSSYHSSHSTYASEEADHAVPPLHHQQSRKSHSKVRRTMYSHKQSQTVTNSHSQTFLAFPTQPPNLHP